MLHIYAYLLQFLFCWLKSDSDAECHDTLGLTACHLRLVFMQYVYGQNLTDKKF